MYKTMKFAVEHKHCLTFITCGNTYFVVIYQFLSLKKKHTFQNKSKTFETNVYGKDPRADKVIHAVHITQSKKRWQCFNYINRHIHVALWYRHSGDTEEENGCMYGKGMNKQAKLHK